MVPGCENVRSIVYGTYDPEAVIDGAFSNSPRIEEDFRRTIGKLERLLEPARGISVATSVGVDTEFMPDGRVVTLSASTRSDGDVADVSDRAKCARLLYTIDGSSTFIGHQVSVDIDSVLRLVREFEQRSSKLETWLQGKNILDTLALARMVDENRPKGGYKLEVLLRSNHRVSGWKHDDSPRDLSNPESWEKEYRVERCRLDAWAAAVLGEELRPDAKGPVEFTHRIIQTLRRIFHAGAHVDLDYASKLTAGFYQEASKAKRKLLAYAAQAGMTEFEPTNDNHIRELLFDRLGMKSTEKTKTGQRSVNKTFLKTYQHEDVVKTLLEFNTHDKRHSTYGAGLAERFLATSDTRRGLLRIRINPLGARTGRRASDKPNTQNWPKDVRKIIVSRFSGGCISDNDYSKLEVVLFAWTAKEWKLLEFFLDEGNGYVKVGRELFGKEVKEDTDDYRTVKSIVLGIQYGMGAYKLAYQLWNNVGVKFSSDWEEHVEQASRLRKTYLAKFPGIPRYIWGQKQALLRNHEVKSLTGRVRHLPCPYGEETPGFGHLLNQAINFPIQSLASDVTGSAMVDVEKALLTKYQLSYEEYHWRLMEGKPPDMPLLINEVHDDLVYDMPPKGLTDNLGLINEIMADVPTLRALVPEFDVPLNTGQKVGSRWGLNDMEVK
jgi:DNA polymerase I-like protein with 3'-5' exonuclease and polymerase domains